MRCGIAPLAPFLLFYLLVIFLSFCAENTDGRKKKNNQKQPKAIQASSSKFQMPPAETHKWFKECAVKHRIDPKDKNGYDFQTLFTHTKIGNSAIFFDLSSAYTGYVSGIDLWKECEEDVHGAKGSTNAVAKCEKKGAATVTIGHQQIQIGTGCKGTGANNNKAKYFLYDCTSNLCHGHKYILVDRPEINYIRHIYYIDKSHVGCLTDLCAEKTMEELYKKNLKQEGKEKVRRHKLFTECAVERHKGDAIETLVKSMPLSPNQILFFSPSHVYIGRRTEADLKVCEDDKAASVKLPISYALLKLDGENLMFTYSKDEHEKEGDKWKVREKSVDENRKTRKMYDKTKVDQTMSKALRFRPIGGRGNRHCAVSTTVGVYNVMLCPPAVCGTSKLFFMRKTKDEGGKERLIGAGEVLNVDHVYIVNNVQNKVVQKVVERCKGSLTIVEGVSKTGAKQEHKLEPPKNTGGNEKKDGKHGKNEKHEEKKKKNEEEEDEEKKKKDGGEKRDKKKKDEDEEHEEKKKKKKEEEEKKKDGGGKGNRDHGEVPNGEGSSCNIRTGRCNSVPIKKKKKEEEKEEEEGKGQHSAQGQPQNKENKVEGKKKEGEHPPSPQHAATAKQQKQKQQQNGASQMHQQQNNPNNHAAKQQQQEEAKKPQLMHSNSLPKNMKITAEKLGQKNANNPKQQQEGGKKPQLTRSNSVPKNMGH